MGETTRFRPLAFGVTEGTLTSGKDGVQFLRASKALPLAAVLAWNDEWAS